MSFDWQIVVGSLLVVALFAALMIPYLVKELRDGKRLAGPMRRLTGGKTTLGPDTPRGAGDLNPGRRGDPAPGEPAGQADPYGERAQRHAPPIRS